MKVRVRATITLLVDVELGDMGDDSPFDSAREMAAFIIEENGCPGTGVVGRAVTDKIQHCEETGTCWACPNGKNEIVEILED